jgi:hypothetical protein
MEQNQPNDPGNVPHHSAEFGKLRKASESFRTVPKVSEPFGKIRNDAERFGNVPQGSERKQNHSLTVRESARIFEAAGVARTERSIVNWCQPSRIGIPRLDSYFDPNERKYYITPQSVELAIAEEKAKAVKINEPAELVRTVPNNSERPSTTVGSSKPDEGRLKDLEPEVMDLKITNKGKDFFIEQLQKERESFVQERQDYVEKLMNFNHKVGELETKLLQLEGPKEHKA